MAHSKKLEMAIEDAIERARTSNVLNRGNVNETLQHRVGSGLLQHALDMGRAIIILVREELPGPALALERPLIEAWLRGLWVAECADDQEIGKFCVNGRPEPWRLAKLAKYVKERVATERKWLEKLLKRLERSDDLNDQTHGGHWQVLHRLGWDEGTIESRVPEERQLELLELVNVIRQKSENLVCKMMDDAEGH